MYSVLTFEFLTSERLGDLRGAAERARLVAVAEQARREAPRRPVRASVWWLLRAVADGAFARAVLRGA